MSAVPQVVAALVLGSGRAVAVNDRELAQPVLVNLAHRVGKNPVDAAVRDLTSNDAACPADSRQSAYGNRMRNGQDG